ncbi:hypothetical protein B0T17DRAFT_67520 [Bombardia bombarda]|uniref:Uncharacterized protein n=1 Tax=Bombardia bombarda TaxID=252184 RepID=A0AA40CG44_9PEZI|nr:hypothetical protein B0T17DRAFT_67520 [Bombardia bombarda]
MQFVTERCGEILTSTGCALQTIFAARSFSDNFILPPLKLASISLCSIRNTTKLDPHSRFQPCPRLLVSTSSPATIPTMCRHVFSIFGCHARELWGIILCKDARSRGVDNNLDHRCQPTLDTEVWVWVICLKQHAQCPNPNCNKHTSPRPEKHVGSVSIRGSQPPPPPQQHAVQQRLPDKKVQTRPKNGLKSKLDNSVMGDGAMKFLEWVAGSQKPRHKPQGKKAPGPSRSVKEDNFEAELNPDPDSDPKPDPKPDFRGFLEKLSKPDRIAITMRAGAEIPTTVS